eukprot:jgi/Undpi1/3310/HiC_scaffold_15.g06684.m1
MAAVKAWKAPPGHVSCLIPNGKDRSIIYNWGVRYEKVVEHASSGSLLRKRPQWWACLASEECRTKGTVRKIDSNSTSGATQHLLLQHEKKSPRTQVSRTPPPVDDDPDRRRALKLEYVKALVIHAANPLGLLENKNVRHFFGMMSPNLGVEGLQSKSVKRLLVEIYAATTRPFAAAMLKAVRAARIPIVHVNVDIWASKSSGEKYIGLGVSYLDDKMRAKSHLLAVKLFRPATSPPSGEGGDSTPSAGSRVGESVLKWVLQVLGQFDLTSEDIAGAVTDAGVEIRSALAKAFPWEWCLPHLLNRVAIEGSGMAPTRLQSKNLPCRALVECMRGVMELFSKSGLCKIELEDRAAETSSGKGSAKGSKAKPPQSAQQRWVGLARIMERFLLNWDVLEAFYRDNLEIAFPLEGRKDEVEEVYSIVQATRNCVDSCHTAAAAEPTSQDAMQQLLLLMTSTCDPAASLEVQRPSPPPPPAGEHLETRRPPLTRPTESLSPTATSTRLSFHQAIAKRVVQPRYGPGYGDHSHLFDMAMLLSPKGRNLKYLDALSSARIGQTGRFSAAPDTVRDKIKHQLVTLVAKSVGAKKSLEESRASHGNDSSSRAKRMKVADDTRRASDRRMQAMRAAGMVDDSDDDDEEGGGGGGGGYEVSDGGGGGYREAMAGDKGRGKKGDRLFARSS